MKTQITDIIEFKEQPKTNPGTYNAFELYFGWSYPTNHKEFNAEDMRTASMNKVQSRFGNGRSWVY